MKDYYVILFSLILKFWSKALILFENDSFIVVNKPNGVEFHGEKGILNSLRVHYKELYGVHRLDKETSGIILFAKTKEIEKTLKALFQDKKVQKIYIGLSSSKPKKKMGTVKGDIEKSRNGSYKLSRTFKNPSYTKFLSYFDTKNNHRLYIFAPKTGKTHQLRVVASSLGASILGDERYGGSSSDRMYLHAYKIKFTLNSQEFEFIAANSDGIYFKQIEELLGQFEIDWAYL